MSLLYALPLLSLLAWLSYRLLNHYRIEQFKALPRMKPNLIWGHMKAVGEYVRELEAGRKGAHEGMFSLFFGESFRGLVLEWKGVGVVLGWGVMSGDCEIGSKGSVFYSARS